MSPERSTAAGVGGINGSGSEHTCRFDFPKRYRLTKTDEYSSVFGFRRALKSTHFLLHYRPRLDAGAGSPGGPSSRLGVVVPKKLVKAAVRRNLIKRLAREQFRLFRQCLPPYDIVLRLASKPGRPDRKLLKIEIVELLQRLDRQRSGTVR